MFQTKFVDHIETQFYVQELFFENRAVCEIMWENNVERSRPQMTARRMRIDAGYLGLQMCSQNM